MSVSISIKPIVIPENSFESFYFSSKKKDQEFSWDMVFENENNFFITPIKIPENYDTNLDIKQTRMSEKKYYSWDVLIRDISIFDFIGEGITSNIFEATFKQGGQTYDCAIKIYKQGFDSTMIHEIEMIQLFQGKEGIVQYISHEINENRLFLELLEIPLLEICSRMRDFSFIGFITDLLQGLLSMKEKDVLHLDLKPENIGLSFDQHLKIMDFGNAQKLSEFKSSPSNFRKESIHYHAFSDLQQNQIGFHTDMWSIGCIIFEIEFGEVLFPFVYEDATNEENLKSVIDTLESDWFANMIKNIPYKDLLLRMLEIDPLKRITVEEALEEIKKF